MAQQETVDSLWRTASVQFAARPMIEFAGRTHSYSAIAFAVDRLAARLAALSGDDRMIGLCLPNSPWFAIALFAAFRAGLTVVNVSPMDSAREARFKLTDTGTTLLVTGQGGAFDTLADTLLGDGTIDRVIICDDAFWRMEGGAPGVRPGATSAVEAVLGAETLEAPHRTLPEIALIQFTGGTTGKPKGAMLSHANLLAGVAMFNAGIQSEPGMQPGEERHIVVLPLFHIYALVSILLRASACGELLLLRSRFDPLQTLRDIELHRATFFFAVPTMLIALLDAPGADRCNFSSLRYCVSGGAPLPREVAERFAALTALSPVTGWGMTETAGAGTLVRRGEAIADGCVGIPLPGCAITIVDHLAPGRALPAGMVGEICVSGPHVTRGYWRREEESQTAFHEGKLLTGDLGYVAENGVLTLVDRKKDLIISSGFNVYPRMVEEAIYEHPMVEEALVYGAPDSYRGEIAVAAIKQRAGTPPLSLAALRDFLSSRLGRHELPARLELHETLPRTPVGKLSRLKLREIATARLPEETIDG